MSTHLPDDTLREMLSGLALEHTPPADGPDRLLAAARAQEGAASHAELAPTHLDPHRARRSSRWAAHLPRSGAAIAAVLVALAIVPLSLEQLSSSDSGSDETASGGSTGVSAPIEPDMAPMPDGSVSGGAPLVGSETARDSAGAPAPAGLPVAPEKVATVAPGEKSFVVRTATLELEVEEGATQAILARLESIATAAGGFVASSRTEPTGYYDPAVGDAPSSIATEGTLVLRVPADQLDEVLARTRALDATVVAYGASGTDVSSTVVDQRARLRALGASRDRYIALLAEAENVGEILAVQAKIDEVQSNMESLTAQLASLEDRANFATLTVAVRAKGSELSPYKQSRGPWAQAFHDAQEGFTGGLRSIVSNSGSFALNLLVLGALFLLGRALYRRWQRSRI